MNKDTAKNVEGTPAGPHKAGNQWAVSEPPRNAKNPATRKRPSDEMMDDMQIRSRKMRWIMGQIFERANQEQPRATQEQPRATQEQPRATKEQPRATQEHKDTLPDISKMKLK
ncbi:uncharacterized protein LOC120354853 [Nilaparvata lugens]|uniref:uncharacterized protein LOC120354853 n=1 Tax=Nilaparvata lugens TaxID=108931 RepID=UPI00193DBA97|nr:uncharacterized protein LOC120354853 [Nilaparvata lugens]